MVNLLKNIEKHFYSKSSYSGKMFEIFPYIIPDYIVNNCAPDIADMILSELAILVSSESDGTILFSDLDENIKREMYDHVVSEVIAKMPRVYDEYM